MPAFLVTLGLDLLKAVVRHVLQVEEEKAVEYVKGLVSGLHVHVTTDPNWVNVVAPQDAVYAMHSETTTVTPAPLSEGPK